MGQGILCVEDEAILAGNIKRYLDRRGYDVIVAGTAAEGLKSLQAAEIDLVLLDINLPDMSGLDVLRKIRETAPQTKVICVTGNGSVQVAVEAMKGGAFDYVAKPVVLSELHLLVEKAIGQERTEGALAYFAAGGRQLSGLDALVGRSAAMQALRDRISTFVRAEANLVDGGPPTVLIRGETGTGKELVARALHLEGTRRKAPFIEINCAAVPVHLLESELFGHERGAFTDAKERKLGLVEAAHGGTLFLDEIGDTDPSIQLKLLKLLEDRTVRRVGGVRDRVVDIRFIAATNRPLEQLVQAGKFRADLYYRLRVATVDVPALRERPDDAVILADFFLKQQAQRYGRANMTLSEEARRLIRNHVWPGNVRELRNSIEQAVLSARGDRIAPEHLSLSPMATLSEPMPDARPAAPAHLDELERNHIRSALAECGGNVTQAARRLGISRDTLRYRMSKHTIVQDPA